MTHEHTPLTRWDPASLAEVADRFCDLKTPWWVAGGFAIELAVGHRIRDHGDIDVLLLRRDQLAVQQALPDWKWWAVDPPGSLRPWVSGEALPESVHDIWCQPAPGEPWRIQIMLDEAYDQEWVSRRDPRVRRPIDTLGLISADGIPYLAPEVQLFYKAKEPRPKDEADLDAVLPTLTDNQRHWLVHASPRLTARIRGPTGCCGNPNDTIGDTPGIPNDPNSLASTQSDLIGRAGRLSATHRKFG